MAIWNYKNQSSIADLGTQTLTGTFHHLAPTWPNPTNPRQRTRSLLRCPVISQHLTARDRLLIMIRFPVDLLDRVRNPG
jgi:hypothetical protein